MGKQPQWQDQFKQPAGHKKTSQPVLTTGQKPVIFLQDGIPDVSL
jgi:hypothetical protein